MLLYREGIYSYDGQNRNSRKHMFTDENFDSPLSDFFLMCTCRCHCEPSAQMVGTMSFKGGLSDLTNIRAT